MIKQHEKGSIDHLRQFGTLVSTRNFTPPCICLAVITEKVDLISRKFYPGITCATIFQYM